MKTLFNITNSQGCTLTTIKAKDEKNALRQARKTWSGKIYASKKPTEYDN